MLFRHLTSACFSFVYIRFSTTVSITKVPAIHFVARASRASRDFALFFARYDSLAPVNAESPEFLPDCSTMTQISIRHNSNCMQTNMVFTISMRYCSFDIYRVIGILAYNQE